MTTPTPPTDGAAELREALRKVIRQYYNRTFDWSMEQLEKGNISAVFSNAEQNQRKLDDPSLDEILAAFAAHLRTIESKLPEKRDMADMRGLGQIGNEGYNDYANAVHALLTAEIEAITKENE